MKTLVGILLTVGLAVGYSQADATCKSKQMTHKTKAKSEKLAVHKSKHSKLETRCVCHAVSSKSGMINAKSYGGYKKTPTTSGSMITPPATSDTMNRNLNNGTLNNGTLNNGGSIDTMQNREQFNPLDTMRLREEQLDRNDGKDFDKPIINNGWENSGLDYQNK